MSKDLEVLKKVYDTTNKYKWKELETTEEYFRALNFPKEAEKFVSNFYTEPNDKFVVVVGSYKTRFYTEEDTFIWQTREYAAIIVLTLEKPLNNFFITDKEYENIEKNKYFNKFKNQTPLNTSNRTFNLVKELYKKASLKVSNLEDIYDQFLS